VRGLGEALASSPVAFAPDAREATDELLTTTRAVRRRLDLERPVEREVIEDCLRIALQAPSGSAQRARFIVVFDPERRAAIADSYRRAWAERHTDPSLLRSRDGASAEYLAENLHRVPVLVVGAVVVPGGTLPPDNQANAWGALLPAAWSYMLAARARGLGTAHTTLHLRYEAEIAALLGLPDDVRQGVLIPTAWALGTSFRPASRSPLDDVVHFDRWTER
jgi:nitroreductase